MRKFILSVVVLFAFNGYLIAREPSWLTKLNQIKPLVSTEKDVERLFGKPIERYSNIGEYKTEIGSLSVDFSEGKCDSNNDAEFDVEKGVVTEFDFSVRKNIKFKSLNINLVGFKKQYGNDTPGAFWYENQQLGIQYHVSNDRLTYISIEPAENYAYLACPEKNEQPEPLKDDVDEATFVRLTQLKPIEHSRADVAAVFGESPSEKSERFDIYFFKNYSIGFSYSTERCTFRDNDYWNVSTGKIVRVSLFFNFNGIAPPVDLSKLKKREQANGLAFYTDETQNIEYEVMDDRVRKVTYRPPPIYKEFVCGK